jgi:hypothetical protein
VYSQYSSGLLLCSSNKKEVQNKPGYIAILFFMSGFQNLAVLIAPENRMNLALIASSLLATADH